MFKQKEKRFAVAITCADWRLHHPRVRLTRRLMHLLNVDAIDLLSLPGPDGLLSSERGGEWNALVAQTAVFIRIRNPAVLALIGHQRCLRHPVSDAEHEVDVAAVAAALKERTLFTGPVAAMILVCRSDARWDFKKVAMV